MASRAVSVSSMRTRRRSSGSATRRTKFSSSLLGSLAGLPSLPKRCARGGQAVPSRASFQQPVAGTARGASAKRGPAKARPWVFKALSAEAMRARKP